MRRLVVGLLVAQWLFGATVVLKRSWVRKFKDRATIEVSFVVEHAHKSPNAQKDDGDLHFAGQAVKEIGLPVVAELVNARQGFSKAAIDVIHAHEESGEAVKMTGVWRFWFEHPAELQVQFKEFEKAKNTNPDHSVEVHPVTQIGGMDLTQTVDFIPEFDGHEAAKAFGLYNKQTVKLRASASAVTMEAKKSKFNYTTFEMRLMGKPFDLVDGGVAVMADVENAEDEDDPLARGIRMIFAPGTAGAKLIRGKKAGEKFRAIGIPRVNLNAVFEAIDGLGTKQLERSLPYEMIIVGIKAAD